GDAEPLDVDRRVDDVGLAAPDAPDAFGDVVGDRDDAVDRLVAPIPPTEPGGDGRGEEPRGEPGARAEVVVGEVPYVAHRREAVAEVERARRRADALGDAVAQREDEIVAGEVEAPYRRGEQREIAAILRGGGREPLDERGHDAAALDHGRDTSGDVDQREERRVGEQLADDLETPLAPTHARQPVVDERDARARPRGSRAVHG